MPTVIEIGSDKIEYCSPCRFLRKSKSSPRGVFVLGYECASVNREIGINDLRPAWCPLLTDEKPAE
jgi:hypothetical protein